MFALSLIVINVYVGLIVRTFDFEAPRQRETLSSILRRNPQLRSPFTLSSPFHIYLDLLHYGHFGHSFFRLLFRRVSFQLGLRLTLLGERMAARLLGSPPAQIAFARAQNLWTAMIKSHGIIIECLSRRSRWKVPQCDDDCKFLVSFGFAFLNRKKVVELNLIDDYLNLLSEVYAMHTVVFNRLLLNKIIFKITLIIIIILKY